jgi:stage II sporulation protein D
MNAGAARSRLLRAVTAVTAGIVLAATAVVVTLAVGGPGASGEVVPVPATGVLTVTGHGNGHGHGLSQYGSRGAAIAGLSAAQIVAFYYPGTTLSSVASKTVRVLLSSDGGATTVQVKAGLSVTGVAGTLPTATYTKWRLVPSGAGLSLQAYGGAGWLSYKTGLPARADFSASDAVVREYKADGSSADYYGTVGAVRSGTGLLTVNRVSLDLYTQGVAPRETPASWPAAALQAQAIAARSYAYYAVSTHASSIYDICDTTSCQVYGGKTRYSATGVHRSSLSTRRPMVAPRLPVASPTCPRRRTRMTTPRRVTRI